MKIYNPVGSKERFLEMFQGVNKMHLNEDILGNNPTPLNVIENSFSELVNGTFKIDRSNTQTKNDETLVEISGVDNNNNQITFVFRINVTEGDQEGILSVDSASLIRFKYTNSTNSRGMDLPENGNSVKEFNEKHGNEIIDAISNYADIDQNSSELDEKYAKAVEFIDKIPYRKGTENMQTNKAYADEKPTNSKLRVSSPELNKFVSEEIDDDAEEDDFLSLPHDYTGEKIDFDADDNNNDIDEPVDDLTPEEEAQVSQAYDNLVARNKTSRNPNYSPTHNEISNEIKRLNGVNTSPTEINNSGNHMAMGRKRVYPSIAEPFLENDISTVNAKDTVKNYYNTISPEFKKELIIKAQKELMNELGINLYQIPKNKLIELVKIRAIDLYHKDLEMMNETDYPKEMEIGKEFSTGSKYPKPKKHRTKKTKISVGESTDHDKYENVVFLQGDEAYEPLERLDREGPDAALEYLKQWHYPGEHDGTNTLGHGREDKVYEKDGYIMSWNPRLDYIELQYDLSKLNEEEVGMSLEPEPDDIKQLAQDKEEQGEILHGGKGDGKSPLNFDPKQIIMGLDVEREHTTDPLIAIEIVLDHLSENPEYYTAMDTPEDSAQEEAAKDAESDKNLEDILLGYQPKNVGEEFDYAADERDYWDKEDLDDENNDLDETIVGAAGATSAVGGDTNNTPNTENSQDYKKYQEYKNKDFDNLPEDQKDEFFGLWKKYRDNK